MTYQAELYKKELGQARVERSNDDWIVEARREAVRISAHAGFVSTVDLRAWAERTGTHPESNLAYSAVFKGKEWKATGHRVPSRHEGGHARRVECWKYQSTVYRREGAK